MKFTLLRRFFTLLKNVNEEWQTTLKVINDDGNDMQWYDGKKYHSWEMKNK
jgi:hypothetical protein